MKIVCAYKSGGWCSFEDVVSLKNQCKDVQADFICYTDMQKEFVNREIETKPLPNGLDGWWSKLACFQECGSVIYLDLDTLVFSDLNLLVNDVIFSQYDSIYMLDAFNSKRKWASGVMAWSGSFQWIFNCFSNYKKEIVKELIN